jgi:ubiquinone/menaquinone biosynthesis C-methylase UbiE
VWGDVDEKHGSRLRDNSIDYVFLVNTLFQLEDKKTAIQEIRRVLKTEGKLILVDWSESFGNIGPREDHVVSEETARLLAEENGFIFEKKLEAGEHHYGILARKL